MPGKLTQKGRPLRLVIDGANDDRLIAVSMTGEERVGRPFEFTIECVSERADVSPASVLGKQGALYVEPSDASKRTFVGIVRRFTRVGTDEQLTRWRVGERHAAEPDCMKRIATRLTDADVAAVAAWLARQEPPKDPSPESSNLVRMPFSCGSQR